MQVEAEQKRQIFLAYCDSPLPMAMVKGQDLEVFQQVCFYALSKENKATVYFYTLSMENQALVCSEYGRPSAVSQSVPYAERGKEKWAMANQCLNESLSQI